MFKDLANDLAGVEEQEDRLGGGGFVKPSGIYTAIVKVAYITESTRSQSKCMNLVLDVDGQEIREQIWYLSGDGRPTYEKNGKKFMLPGFQTINDVSLLITGYPFTEQVTEDKTIKVYDFEQSAEVEKNLPVVTALVNKQIIVGMLHVKENKRAKNAAGDYEDTNEAREFNTFDKFFHVDSKKTVVELQKKVDLPEEDLFISQWATKNAGEMRDYFKPVQDGATAPAGSAGAAPSGGGGSQSKSLFA